ncbi:MAG: MMPL family transporter [Pseudomonadota bacterium]
MKTNRFAVALLGLTLLLAVAIVSTRLNVSTDMGAFLPRGGEAGEQLLLEQLRSGSSARVLLLAIEGEKVEHLARLSSELAAALRQSERFERVFNGELSLDIAADSPWFDYRYLLQENDFSAAALEQALQQRLRELRSPLGLYTRQTLAEDPTAAFRKHLQQWQGAVRPQTRNGVWFSEDGRALLFAETRAAGFDLDAQEVNLAAVRRTFSELQGGEQAELVISGAPAIAVASRDTIRAEAQVASFAAAIAVAIILLFAYRSPRLWLLSTLPPVGALLVALAITTLLFETVHGITIAFGVILLGVAIDYPIHLFSHLVPGRTPGVSLKRIWPTLRLGVISTIIGFAALLFTRFEGLLQLGVFAISGLLTAALVTRYLLLPLLPDVWSGRDYARTVGFAGTGDRRRLPVLFGVLLCALAYLYTTGGPRWERDIAALSPVPDSVRQQDRTLRSALPVTELNQLLLVQGEDPQAVLQTQERLQPTLRAWVGEGLFSGYTLAAQYLPSAARQRARQQRLPDAESLRRNLAQAAEGSLFREGTFAPFLEAVERSRELPPLTLEQVAETPLGLSLAGRLFERDNQWWGVIRLSGLHDSAALQQRLDEARLPLRYVDLNTEAGAMMSGFRADALYSLAWGALLILLIIAMSVRSLRRVVQVGLSLAAALAVTVALLHALGERLTLFHLTSLLLVAGIGIDYSLFFSRDDAGSERGRTLHALRVCAISTTTVFAILAFSRLPVLHAIGSTVLIGVPLAYLLARLAGHSAGEAPVGGEGAETARLSR